MEEIRDDIKKILEKTTRIETALWPDEGQPGTLTKHAERIDSLENWRSYLVGAWAVITTAAATVFGIHTHGGHK
jgi:hypothetical protein